MKLSDYINPEDATVIGPLVSILEFYGQNENFRPCTVSASLKPVHICFLP